MLTKAKKKPQSAGIFSISGMKNFFQDRIAELHNITWPTRKQAVHSMITVLTIMVLVGIFLGVVDYFLNEGVLFLLNR